ncbi:uncharacterized protein K02A2.6-like [Planococcus citri]
MTKKKKRAEKVMATNGFPALFAEFNAAVEDFASYLDRFNCYIDCLGITDLQKPKFFIASAGAEIFALARRLAAPANPKDLDYDKLTKLLTDHYHPAPLEDVARHIFRHRKQKDGESFNSFYASLKELSRDCNFADQTRLDEELKAQIIGGTNDGTLQKYCFATPKLALKDVVAKAVASEQATKGVDHFNAPNVKASESSSVNRVNERVNKKHFQKKKSNGSKNYASNSNSNSTNPGASHANSSKSNFTPNMVVICYRCGKKNHKAPDCRHKNAVCSSCQKVGHLNTVCGKSRKELLEIQKPAAENKSCNVVDIGQLGEENLPTIADGDDPPPPKIFIDVQVEGKAVKFEADCGSGFTLISEKTFRELNLSEKLRPCKFVLKTYDRGIVRIRGYIPVHVNFKGKSYRQVLRVVQGDYDSVIGRDWLLPMNIDIREFIETNKISVSVNLNLKSEIDKLVSEFSELFSDNITKVPNYCADFKLKADATPVFCRARTVPFALREAVDKEIDRLVAAGIYVPAESSEWATPIVPVIKSNGKIRLVGDYSVTINKAIIPEEYPIPNIEEEILQDFANCVHFSKFDIKEAYMLLGVSEACSKLLTVNTPKGLFYVTSLNYGLQCAPAKWQRFIESIFKGLKWCKWFFDDGKISSKTAAEHLARMRKFFEICRENNLRLNKSKCDFLTDHLKFLGFVVDKNGIHKTTEKIDLILNAKRPTNVTELKSFEGLVGYYSRFVPNFSDKFAPLNALTRKNAKFDWSDECEQAFQLIKKEIASERVLCHFDPAKPLILSTDASPYAIGAVLSHQFREGERPIAFVSRTLTETERRYSQLDRESLAIYWAVKRFFNYLFGRKFILFTDCKPLTSILAAHAAKPSLSATRLLHYALFLQGFDYEIRYRRSEDNKNADFASRFPCQIANSNQIDVPAWCYTNLLHSLPVKAAEIGAETLAETSSATLLRQLRGEEPCHMKTAELAQYSLQDNCILRNDRVYIPEKLRQRVLTELHQGHLGMVKCKSLARSYVYWPGIDHDIEDMVRSCASCDQNAKNPSKCVSHPWLPPSQPWQRIHFDFGEIENTNLLIIVDAYAKWPEVFVVKSTNSAQVIECFEKCFSRFGLPEVAVSDNGPQFVSEELREYFRQNCIHHLTSPSYHPQSNGQAERFVQIVKKGLKCTRNGPFFKRLQAVLRSYRRAPLSNGKSPFELMFGRKMRTVISAVKPISKFEQNSQLSKREFCEGEKVKFRLFRGPKKWEVGSISGKLGNVVYLVISGGKTHRRHINHLCRTNLDEFNSAILIDDPAPDSAPIIPDQAEPELPIQPQPAVRRSSRIRRQPQWFQPS